MREGLRDSISSHQLGQEIQLTGFLVPTKDGKWCLAETPAVKNCCLDKEAVFILLPDFLWEGPPPRLPISLLGALVKTVDGPALQNVVRVSSTHSTPDWKSAAIFCWVFVGLFVGFWVYKKFR